MTAHFSGDSGEASAEQQHRRRFGNRSRLVLCGYHKSDAVVEEVAIRIKAERNSAVVEEIVAKNVPLIYVERVVSINVSPTALRDQPSVCVYAEEEVFPNLCCVR